MGRVTHPILCVDLSGSSWYGSCPSSSLEPAFVWTPAYTVDYMCVLATKATCLTLRDIFSTRLPARTVSLPRLRSNTQPLSAVPEYTINIQSSMDGPDAF